MQKSSRRHSTFFIILGYFVVQLLLVLTIDILKLNLYVHLIFVMTSLVTYVAIASKNPGYVISEGPSKSINVNNPIQEEVKEEKENIPQKNSDEVIPSDIEYNDLGLQSKVMDKESNEKPQLIMKKSQKIIVEKPSAIQEIYPLPLKEVQRYCKKCRQQQQLRVRHCVECGRCVRTFDHHCPWINNCVGQKNKLYFMLYLLFQQVQFFVIAADLTLNLINNFQLPILFLCIGTYLLGFVLFGIFCFHIYAICSNITTWEHLRWSRIDYLNIFIRANLKSLFDKGIKLNLSIFIRSNCSREAINWQQQLNPQANNCLVGTNSSTQRRLSQRAV